MFYGEHFNKFATTTLNPLVVVACSKAEDLDSRGEYAGAAVSLRSNFTFCPESQISDQMGGWMGALKKYYKEPFSSDYPN